MSVPQVSVVIAAKDEETFVREAVESILAQQGVTLELIFVDDHSTDRTLAIVREIASADARLRVTTNPGTGKVAAFNHGVALAAGDFTCVFAGDDIMPPGSLAARHARVASSGDGRPVVGLSKLITMSDAKEFDGQVVPRRPGVGALSGVSPLMNRAAVAIVFPVPDGLPNEDTWMELTALHLPELELVHSDVVGCQWRVHAGNSINFMSTYDDYNRKYTARMNALPIFQRKFAERMDAIQRRVVAAKVRNEEARRRGSLLGVLSSGAGVVDRLRALSTTAPWLYAIRRRLFRLFSGW